MYNRFMLGLSFLLILLINLNVPEAGRMKSDAG